MTPLVHTEATIAQGVPEQMGPVIENLYTMFRTGRAGVLTNDIRNVTGRKRAHSVSGAERNASAFS